MISPSKYVIETQISHIMLTLQKSTKENETKRKEYLKFCICTKHLSFITPKPSRYENKKINFNLVYMLIHEYIAQQTPMFSEILTFKAKPPRNEPLEPSLSS